MTLVTIAAAVLSIAVIGGATLAHRHARGRRVAFALGLGHAALAATGLAVLAVAVFGASQPMAVNAALLLFALALVGGLFLLLFRLQQEWPPGFMMALHGATAAVALALLWAGLLIGG